MVSWLSDAPPVLEECARAATQPQLLRTILQYQTCLGHLDPAASLPPKMGDAILTSLSLPPSGKPASTRLPSTRLPSNQPSTSAGLRSSSRRSAAVTGRRTPAAAEAPFITPVIAVISNKDVPAMISAGKKKAKARADEDGSKASNRVKRKQPDDNSVDGEEEEEGADTEADKRPVGRGASKRWRRTNGRRRRGGSQSLSEDGDLNPDPWGAPSKIHGASSLLPTDLSLHVAVSSCLLNQPTVLLRRLDGAAFGAANTDTNE
ncbi:hypothetical protein CRUP_021215 [Coryphaenoides rupestris]|nr:hypothetical protein CRUP_021215 [Coryphaenoides rupestris]